MKLIKMVDPNTFEPSIGVIGEDNELLHKIQYRVSMDENYLNLDTMCKEKGIDPVEFKTAMENLFNGR